MNHYERAKAGLDRTLRKLGAPCRFDDRNTSDRMVDPATGDTSTPSMPSPVNVTMIVSRTTTKADDGVTIRRSTIAIMAADELVPMVGDRIASGGIHYRIVNTPILHYVGGQPLCYRMNLEAGG
jgi:hypothetical protein